MIFNERTLAVDAEEFADGLDRAMRAVVRIQGESGQISSTGWMLTPGIVIAPEYLVGTPPEADTASAWIVEATRNGKTLWLERGRAVRLPAGSVPELGMEFRIALIVLPRRHKIPRLGLSANTPNAGELASVLSFARGLRRMTLSFGKLTGWEESHLDYDAATEPGSGGAPLLDERLHVLGMHMTASGNVNRAVSRSAIIAMLQQLPQWEEIAEFHRIANVTAGRRELARKPTQKADRPDRALISAAVRLNVEPRKLDKRQREVLRANVVDSDSKPWTLQSKVRQSVIQAVGSIDALRRYAPAKSDSAGQRVIAKILRGPPYDLDDNTEEELAWWIQASRWFAGVAPDLPTPAQANRELQRRRVRGRLNALAGPEFVGRKDELKTIGDWYRGESAAPLCISGVGGVGKSALVAKFATSLPEDTLILWLDFDRADLAPDDAVSVVDALAAQASVQLDGFSVPTVSATDWQAGARAFARELADRKLKRPPLLVLDSFEVAQYAERYQELWPVLEEIGKVVSPLRVIVSGRAPVKTLQLLGHSAMPLPIGGLKPKYAREWLHDHKIRSEKVVDEVVERSRGLPLVLHLAVRLVEAGGKVSALPKTLPPEIIAGFLYDRILDRVQHASLKPLAQGALVLRRLTEDAIEPVLEGLVQLPPGKPEDWFRDLSREASLVDGTAVLRLRPEIRSAALELLEHDNPQLVRSVDEAAARWYAQQDVNDPEIAAELVYHRLRLGDQAGAQDAWREGVSRHLQYADEDLDGATRTWLRARLGSDSVNAAPLEAWEHEAAERIRAARLRNHDRIASEILSERTERSHDSALLFHEVYAMRERGDRKAALDRLSGRGTASATIGRERSLLHALLLSELGRKPEADAVLRPLCTQQSWSDRPRGQRELAAVCAARVRLAVDFEAEVELLKLLQGENQRPGLLNQLSQLDVLLPELDARLEELTRMLDSSFGLMIQTDASAATIVESTIERVRKSVLPGEPAALRAMRERIGAGEYPASSPWPASAPDVLAQVLLRSWRRWSVLSRSPLFFDAQQILKEEKPGALDAGIVAAYALFAGVPGFVIELLDPEGAYAYPLDRLVDKVFDERSRWGTATGHVEQLRAQIPPEFRPKSAGFATRARRFALRSRGLILHYSTPDPLEVLVDNFAGKVRADG